MIKDPIKLCNAPRYKALCKTLGACLGHRKSSEIPEFLIDSPLLWDAVVQLMTGILHCQVQLLAQVRTPLWQGRQARQLQQGSTVQRPEGDAQSAFLDPLNVLTLFLCQGGMPRLAGVFQGWDGWRIRKCSLAPGIPHHSSWVDKAQSPLGWLCWALNVHGDPTWGPHWWSIWATLQISPAQLTTHQSQWAGNSQVAQQTRKPALLFS